LYELPDDLRGRLRSAIITKCKGHPGDCGDSGMVDPPAQPGPSTPK
jgi:hypothetical protein